MGDMDRGQSPGRGTDIGHGFGLALGAGTWACAWDLRHGLEAYGLGPGRMDHDMSDKLTTTDGSRLDS